MNFGGQIAGERRRLIYFSSSCTMVLTLEVAYAVPVNTLSPDCFLCIIFLLKPLSLTFTVSNNGNNGNNEKHIIIFMSYDSMNDI
jgi:hypothetical protein